mmetsp:Transcript_9441/g.17705  ORF Transcript_9441/g.17705 Transcript_9441/m.17705 type:complete len:99 (-) Transcript_9441:1496-1792(-)
MKRDYKNATNQSIHQSMYIYFSQILKNVLSSKEFLHLPHRIVNLLFLMLSLNYITTMEEALQSTALAFSTFPLPAASLAPPPSPLPPPPLPSALAHSP